MKADILERRQLGSTGPMVSPVGLGCWSFAGAYGPTNTVECHATLTKAMELGIDFLDTADVYGRGISEQMIGTFIKDHPSYFRIATKGGIRRDTHSKERFFDNSPVYLREALEMSLRRLGVEHVDLYYVHRREPNRPIEEVMQTLIGFKQEGKIGGIGFSEIAPSSLRRAHAVHPVMAVQSEYSLWSRMPELGVLQTCKELGTTFVPFSPLGRGVFTSTPPNPASFKKGDFRIGNPRFSEPNYSYNLQALEPFKAFAAELNATPAELAIAWLLNQGDHVLPIPGTRSGAHLEEISQAAKRVLTKADQVQINRILPPGFAHGDRYSPAQMIGAERYC